MAKPNSTPASEVFFDLNARYVVDPSATVDALVDDGALILGSALGVLECHADDYSACEDQDAASAFWCALYALRQTLAVIGAAQHRLMAANAAPRNQ